MNETFSIVSSNSTSSDVGSSFSDSIKTLAYVVIVSPDAVVTS